MRLTFDKLREATVSRRNEHFFGVEEWSPNDWATRNSAATRWARTRNSRCPNQVTLLAQAAEEVADLVIYADLLAARLGIDLGEAIRAKFNKVSDKVGASQKL